MSYIKYIRERTQNNSCDLHLVVQVKALHCIINHRDIKEQRIQWNCNHTREYKYLIPLLKECPLWIKNFKPRTQAFRPCTIKRIGLQWFFNPLHPLWTRFHASLKFFWKRVYCQSDSSWMHSIIFSTFLWLPVLKPEQNIVYDLNISFMTLKPRNIKGSNEVKKHLKNQHAEYKIPNVIMVVANETLCVSSSIHGCCGSNRVSKRHGINNIHWTPLTYR